MNKIIWTLKFSLILIAAAVGPAAVGNAEAQQPIKIGYLSSLSGPFTPWGILVRDGMKLAVAEVNAELWPNVGDGSGVRRQLFETAI